MNVILTGGFSEIFELCEECGHEIIGFIDKLNTKHKFTNYPYAYLGSDDDFPYWEYADIAHFIVCPDNPRIRNAIYVRQEKHQLTYANLISPESKISRTVSIGRGNVIQFGCHVSSSVVIGDFVKLNAYANVMHDVKVGSFTTIAPNAAVMGRVNIGRGCYIGANSTIIQEITVCDDVVVGAGAVVTKDLSHPGTYVGIPARRIG